MSFWYSLLQKEKQRLKTQINEYVWLLRYNIDKFQIIGGYIKQ